MFRRFRFKEVEKFNNNSQPSQKYEYDPVALKKYDALFGDDDLPSEEQLSTSTSTEDPQAIYDRLMGDI